MNLSKIIKTEIILVMLLSIIFAAESRAQNPAPELQTTQMKIGHVWLGVTANGGKGSFDYTSGFFPNDFGIIGHRGQTAEAWSAAGINLTATHWRNPLTDSVEAAAVYSFVTDSLPIGRVTKPLTNYTRIKYPQISVSSFQPVNLTPFADYNPGYSEFQNHSFDEIVEVRDSTILGVTVDRKLMAWTQNFNNDYIMADLIFTNTSADTLDSLYINLQESSYGLQYSYGLQPSVPSSYLINPIAVWQHYYGGRPGDSLRVFYEYSASDPNKSGDNMGSPVRPQKGRLLNPNFTYYTIIHASQSPYTDLANDINDPLQPRVTYVGANIPFTSQSDQYGSKNFYAIRGAFSDVYPMPGQNPDSHHGYNSDEYGVSIYSKTPAGSATNASFRYSSFGPYKFYPGQKLHIVYASGFAGIGYQKGKEIGEKWSNGTLTDPPNMPDATLGWFPQGFKFPDGASENDKKKDRWISMGIDSVMLSAWRAKWNYEHNYNIPQAPPPPSSVTITANSDGVNIEWSDPDAESLTNFAGYRIMRRISNADTVFYQPIYDSDATDKSAAHSYVDKNVFVGAQYYYYIQSKAKIADNDLNADPTTRGKIMYSSREIYPDYDYVKPQRYAQDDMSKIRIVPNPYNINDPILQQYGVTDRRQISFFNLPAKCTIKIYTENGDLVQTIIHDKAEGTGQEDWDMLTSSQQVINSGLYIAVIQNAAGELTYQKFVVVR